MSEHIIKNFENLAQSDLRRAALALMEVAYAAIDTQKVVGRTVQIAGDVLTINGIERHLAPDGRLFFIGVGKCAADGALAIEEVCGDRLTGGIALDVHIAPTCLATLKRIECFSGTHPSPSEANVEATKHILALLSGMTDKDTVIMLISGGGSTLLCSPVFGTCTDEIMLLKQLFNVGATIQEINTVRKHASLARGGNLAKAAFPAQVVSMIFSDVPGNDLEFISSGPTVRDTTTVADATAILEKYKIVLDARMLIETPKEAQYFEKVANTLVVSNIHALEAMKTEAQRQGFNTNIVTDILTGEASLVGHDIVNTLHTLPPKTAYLYGGETTVTITGGTGKGGREQEMALAGLTDIRDGELLVPFASDGWDNTENAGGVCDTITKDAAVKAGISVEEYLSQHRSFDFFEATGNAIKTGETGANVSDLIIALKA